MTVRGLVYAKAGAAPALEEILLEEPGENEVRIRVVACGVCHTDLTIKNLQGNGMPFPIVLGHEGAGYIEQVGDAAVSLASNLRRGLTGDVLFVAQGYHVLGF